MRIIDFFDNSNTTFAAVMNRDHQTVNVDITSQTKVSFDFWKESIIWFSLFVIVSGDGGGWGDDQTGGNYVGIRIIDFFNNLVGNDNVMMLSWCNKMGLSLKSQKSVTSNDIFHFVICESRMTKVCCTLARHMTADLAYFIFSCVNVFKLTNSDKKLLSWYHKSLLLQSCEDSWGLVRIGEPQKISHHHCNGNKCS